MGKKLKKLKKRGVSGRRWVRSDRRILEPGQRDKSGLLEVMTADVGTKGGHRYALVECLCGCRFRGEVRIDNFLAGTASCPTRRKAANRRFMERKTHIERMKMIGALLDGKNLPEAAQKVAVNYAGELASNAELRAKVRAFTQSKSLAERDIKRAVQLAGRTKPVQSVQPVRTPTLEAPRPKRPTLAKPDQFRKFASVEEAKQAYEQWVAWYAELDPFAPDLARLKREYDAKEYEHKAA